MALILLIMLMFGTIYITYSLTQEKRELEEEIELLRRYITDAEYDKRYNQDKKD